MHREVDADAAGQPPADDRPSLGLDEDPFLRLTDADFDRLRTDPYELAEELRFGAFWLAHLETTAGQAHGRALDLAAEAIEALLGTDTLAGSPNAAPPPPNATSVASPVAEPSGPAARATPDAEASDRPPAHASAAIAQRHDAYVEYVARLEQYVMTLRLRSAELHGQAAHADGGLRTNEAHVVDQLITSYVDYVARLHRYVEQLRRLRQAGTSET